MRSYFYIAVLTALVSACAGEGTIQPSETLDERTGITVGALKEPIEFVAESENAVLANSKRSSFAYMGPVEWDRMGDITYALWIDVAPGNDRPVADLHTPGALTLMLDDGPMMLTATQAPRAGRGPYRPVVTWGQTGYFALNVDMLKRMAHSEKIRLAFRSAGTTTVDFIPTAGTQATLEEFTRARGITDD